MHWSKEVFQSTPPARGATIFVDYVQLITPISIHAPREGGDKYSSGVNLRFFHFNPRPPRGGRQQPQDQLERPVEISIHAPREGGATCQRLKDMYKGDISIHAPREGGRPD